MGTSTDHAYPYRAGTAAVRLALVITLAAMVTAGCTMVQFAYDNAGRLLLNRMDSYVRFDDEQRARVSDALEARLDRHRREELPRLGALLRVASRSVEQGFDADEMATFAENTRALLRELVDQSLPLLALAITDLSSSQMDYLESNMAQALEEYRNVYAVHEPAKARLRNRGLRAVELVEQWTGPLRPEQAKLVQALRDAMPDAAGAWADYRDQGQRKLLTLLRAGGSPEDIEAFLREWLLELADAPPEIVQMRTDITDGLERMILELHPTLDEAQRLSVVERLAGFAEDAEALAARAAD